MDERKRELLKQLETFFNEDEDIAEVSLFTKEELETQMDVLRLLIIDYGPDLMDVLAECSFLPLQDTEVLYFSTVLTIRMDIPKEGLSSLSGAVSRLNFFLPYGSFSVSGDGTMLVYKATAAFPSEWDDDKLYKLMEISADSALFVAESYTEVLSQVADGKMPLSDFISTLPQV